MWMKYRHKFCYGAQEEWTWRDLGGDTSEVAVEDTCEELSREYDYSDKYRGIDYELVDRPPDEVIHAHLVEASAAAKRWQRRAEELARLLED